MYRNFVRLRWLRQLRYNPSSLASFQNQRQQNHNNHKKSYNYTKPLISGMTIIGVFKELVGIDPVRLDDDPVKDRIKQSWLQRKRGNFDMAITILEDVLKEVRESEGEESMPVTRILDELANTYYYKGDLDQAMGHFKLIVQRLIQLHGKNESSPEFLGISLKMADIYARQGQLDNAEIGYRHCVSNQMKIVDKHLSKFFISKGAHIESKHKVDTFGNEYTDPLALFAMCLQQYGHFIIDYREESRTQEAEECMDEVLKLSYHIFGTNHSHCVHILNNFGAACLLKTRFETALKYLKLGIDRVLANDECSDIIVGYYCNYAEALFHTDHFDEAIKYADTALRMSNSSPDNIKNYAKEFVKQMKYDLRRAKREAQQKAGGTSQQSAGWFDWLWGSSSTPPPTQPASTAA